VPLVIVPAFHIRSPTGRLRDEFAARDETQEDPV
jgi:hypothetical protein